MSDTIVPAMEADLRDLDAAYERLESYLTRFRDGLAAGEITPAAGDYGDWSECTMELFEGPLSPGRFHCWGTLDADMGAEERVTEADLEVLDGWLRAVPGLSAEALSKLIDYLPTMRQSVLTDLEGYHAQLGQEQQERAARLARIHRVRDRAEKQRLHLVELRGGSWALLDLSLDEVERLFQATKATKATKVMQSAA